MGAQVGFARFYLFIGMKARAWTDRSPVVDSCKAVGLFNGIPAFPLASCDTATDLPGDLTFRRTAYSADEKPGSSTATERNSALHNRGKYLWILYFWRSSLFLLVGTAD
jgi:hypothetical protein